MKARSLWRRHDEQWREPGQVISHWRDGDRVDPTLLACRAQGAWWETLARAGVTLLLTREYEHLVMAVRSRGGRPRVSFMPLPHPSGLVADRERGVVHVASTRNPNEVFELRPARGVPPRGDPRGEASAEETVLIPGRSRFFPGRSYIHDLAVIGGDLYAASSGQNAIIRLSGGDAPRPAWWPRCIETPRGPVFERNHLQLNSIAAGETLKESFFSASTDRMTRLRPGHLGFPVDGRGVIFSGRTRDPVARGLTRPHSARLHRGRVWVDNSGYGELGFVEDGRFVAVARLPGWTRGLCFKGDVAFVGTSRVIPRFEAYAPGLDPARSLCGVHAVDLRSGRILGSLLWPNGNQLFAVDWIPGALARGFPFGPGSGHGPRSRSRLFYAFSTSPSGRRRMGKKVGVAVL
ncbi:MAG: DUF4915 domain-containing protein [Elusimicrobia bacterium]|nr:DUF4915 domain-containing protein [Elusimicrobiota bacterium]